MDLTFFRTLRQTLRTLRIFEAFSISTEPRVSQLLSQLLSLVSRTRVNHLNQFSSKPPGVVSTRGSLDRGQIRSGINRGNNPRSGRGIKVGNKEEHFSEVAEGEEVEDETAPETLVQIIDFSDCY